MNPEDFEQYKENPVFDSLIAFDGLHIADEDTSTNEESCSTHSHRGGRPKHSETSLLSQFHTSNRNKPVKKETLRIYFYRGVKICLTNIRRKKPMTRRINRLFRGSSSLHYHAYLSNLREYVSLLNSCLVEPNQIGEKSHNDHFFRRIFQKDEVKECMRKYLDFVLFETDPGVLCERLNITCCQEAEHGVKCSEKWEALKKFCVEQLFSLD